MESRQFDRIVKTLATETSRRGVFRGALAAAGALAVHRAGAQDIVTICHFTGSDTNPYNIITVSTNALDQHVANHGDFLYTDCCLDVECSGLTDQCNIGVCDAGTCIAVPQVGFECDDDDACTEYDVCTTAGTCEGTLIDCDDEDICTTDSCVEGKCLYEHIKGCCHTNDDCPEELVCIDNVCTEDPNPECAGATCTTFIECSSENPDCVCTTLFNGGGFCVPGSTLCEPLTRCPNGSECAGDELCAVNTCCDVNVCIPIDLECVLGFTSSRAEAPGEPDGLTIGGR